ncbi:MAG TPA: VWA domain-containing protein [Candidatus Angelobacter sp.]|nr:VWA domain-containing protein [Candidatus Angelobacter sp.]
MHLKYLKLKYRSQFKGWLLLWPAMVLLLLPGPALRSQQEPTISVDVKVVNVLASVRDKHGAVVRYLNKDDFVLEEDGHPQEIRYFTKESDLPLTLGLLVDTSLSQRRVLEEERSASYSFLDHMLRESKDTAFVIHFDREVELLQDVTSSKQQLEAALKLLQTPDFSRPVSGGQTGHRRGGGGTLLYDAVYLAADELMKKQQGRKALIILSDGVDTGSQLTLETAIESAQKADTIVYSILFKDDAAYGHSGGFGFPGGGGWGRRGRGQRFPQASLPDGKKTLEKISKQTGARLFEVSKNLSIEEIYRQIQEELRNQYNLGYTPDKATSRPGYHKIHLATRQKDLSVQARDGYYLSAR